jgi:hypothetical protein
MTRRSLRVGALSCLALVIGALAQSAQGASPASGHLGPKHQLLRYTTAQQYGSPFGLVIAAAGSQGVECPPAALDPKDLVCDHFALTVDVPASYWESHHGGVQVSVPPNFYGYVYDAQGELVSFSPYSSGEVHPMTVASAAGDYEIRLAPYVALGTSDVTVRWVSKPGKDGGFPEVGFTAYHGRKMSSPPSKRPMNSEIAYSGPVAKWTTTYVGQDAVEPTIGVDRSGTAFFAAFRSSTTSQTSLLLRSTDYNRSWQSVQPDAAGTGAEDHPISQDPYVYVDKDYGRVFDIDLTLGGSYLDFSDDQGEHWTRGVAVSPFGVNDHQTLFAAKPPPESGLLSTLDLRFPKFVYYCVNQINGTWCSKSIDGGITFVPGPVPAYVGASASSSTAGFCGGLTGQGVGDSKGRIFIPRGYCGEAQLAISNDAGTTWQQVVVSRSVPSAGIQTAVAVDAKDNLYYVWWDERWHQPYLSVSRDHGESWSTPLMIAPPDVAEVNFPSVDAGTFGRVAIAFPGTEVADRTDLTRPWSSYVVLSTDALSSNPTFMSSVVNPGGIDDPIHRGDCLQRCGLMYDFLDVTVANDYVGTVWVTAVDTCTSLDDCSDSTVGGHSDGAGRDGASDDSRGVAVRQRSGPPMRVSG